MISLDPRATAADARAAALALSEDEAQALLYDWDLWGRPEQLWPEGEWRTWLILGGRGSGKTRPGAEAVRRFVNANPGARVALVGPTSADCRDVMMEGDSGLLNVFPAEERPYYKPSRRFVQFRNGAQGFTYSAEEPERLRGPAHAFAWCDEIATYTEWPDVWSNLQFGLRIGDAPRAVATTTPKALRWLKELANDRGTRLSKCTTWDNRANLSPAALAEFERIYGGTRIGRQELEGELLEEAEGALWRRAQIDALRVRETPDLVRIVVAIDPAVTSGPDSDETGIVAFGYGVDGHGYVLEDGSCRLPPDQWAARAVSMFDKWDADRIVAEGNNGGDLVEKVIRTVRATVPYEKVIASRGKVTRAEPIAALYEQGKIHHAGGFAALEDEQVNFVPGALTKSPNRVDALVWAASQTMLKPMRVGRVLGV